MASILRQIVAGPRTRHPEAGLDLCYVTSQIIATSGPSGTYPQRAYRNPLDQLVKFLDYKHGEDWAIWEFRAEGTGYPDSEVYGRVNHYPWPDHHPPPFRLVPLIMAGMRNWLLEEPEDGDDGKGGDGKGKKSMRKARKGRVVVVHCKAGKGRSGTMACSYLISECGWKQSEALARFTERRMRPGFGQGVSIPSQLRWVGYVDQWTKSGKIYVERQIEIMEVHVWGLRDGVKVQVEGFVDEGKTIKLFHVFSKKERVIVEGNAPPGGGVKSLIRSEMTGYKTPTKSTEQLDGPAGRPNPTRSRTIVEPKSDIPTIQTPELPQLDGAQVSKSNADNGNEAGGQAVIFRPASRVILPSSDINIDFERRNKAAMGWTMVTSVAHVWFNAYFEGNGPAQNGVPDTNGLFEIEWDKMDGIKGSARKGIPAFDRLAVVWKAYEPPGQASSDIIHEPGPDSPVPQMAAADWKGGNVTSPGSGKDLGLRTESPHSAQVSKASSMKSTKEKDDDGDSMEGVRVSTPSGGENLDTAGNESDLKRKIVDKLAAINLGSNSQSQPPSEVPRHTSTDVSGGLDTASSTTPQDTSTPQFNQHKKPVAGEVSGVSSIATSDLPGGIPEDEMTNAHDHKLGHIASIQKS